MTSKRLAVGGTGRHAHTPDAELRYGEKEHRAEGQRWRIVWRCSATSTATFGPLRKLGCLLQLGAC